MSNLVFANTKLTEYEWNREKFGKTVSVADKRRVIEYYPEGKPRENIPAWGRVNLRLSILY